MSIKDRSSRTAWIAALEGIVITLLQDHIAALSGEQKKALAERIKANTQGACDDIAALAPTSAMRGSLSPDAAKKIAAEIAGAARYLCKEYENEILAAAPAATPPAPKA
jgi:hypothetical protein